MSKEGFRSSVGVDSVLLVRVDDPKKELLRSLEETSGAQTAPLVPAHDALGLVTTARDTREPGQGIQRVGPFDAAELRHTLGQAVYFVIPLRKRVVNSEPLSDRISVGRARNNDIVLREETVSKFQAWFEIDDEGNWYVVEAASKNPILINRVAFGTRRMHQLQGGDVITFGAVDAIFSPTETLYDALAAE